MSAARRAAIGCLLGLGVLPGCYQEIRIDDPDGSPPPWDAAMYVDAGTDASGEFIPPLGKCVEPTGVDLLLVVDNSNSMTEEQESLAVQLPALVRALVEPPDVDGDGAPDWLPVEDLQVGVITTDMGTGGAVVPTCARSEFGDDGILRTLGRTDLAGCMATYPSFLTFEPLAGGTEAFAFDVGCVARTGTGGCGFEQPLEAALKALAPARPAPWTGPGYEPPTFFRGTTGHGDTTNGGFVRDDTLLAVVMVTDEEDCSAADPAIFDPSSPVYGAVDLNLRCFSFPEAVHPVERYVRGLAALRANRPDLFAFGLIAGIPVDLAVSQPRDADFQAILDDPRMFEQVDPASPGRLIPSCNVGGRGIAFPPRRLVEVARQLSGHRSTVQSICQEDFSPAASAIARLLGTRACATYME